MHESHTPLIPLGDALRALPLPAPPASAWLQLHAELQRRRRARTRWAVALAASVLLALTPLLLWQRASMPASAPDIAAAEPATAAPAVASAPDPLPALIQESAQLEALLALSSDEPQSAEIAALNASYADRLQWIDTLLASADAPASAQVPLWRERVLLLRRLAGIESGQQMLAAQGDSAASLVATF